MGKPDSENLQFEPLRNPGFGGVPSPMVSVEVQSAIEEAYQRAPGSVYNLTASWGRSGATPVHSWLQNDTIPSNRTGRVIPFYNAEIVQVMVSNENANTFTIEVYEYNGTTFTLKATVTLTAERKKVVLFTGVTLTYGNELSVKVGSGSAKNLVVSALVRGTPAP